MRLMLSWLILSSMLLLPLTAWAKGVPVGVASEEQKEAAKAPYVEGRKAFDEGRHDEALRQFQASYDIVASPNSHHMMAMAMRELGQLAQAYEHFGEVAAEADEAAKVDEKYTKAADNARAKRQEMMRLIGFLNLDISSPDAAQSVTIGDRPIERSRWTGPIPATPGATTVVMALNAGGEVTANVTVVAGQSHDVVLRAPSADPTPLPEPVEEEGEGIEWVTNYRIAAYAAAGLGLISFAVAGGLGAAAQSKHDDLAATCVAGPCPQLEDDISSGESLQVATNAMIVVGVVLVAGGVALWLVAPDARDGLLHDGDEPDDAPEDGSDFSMYAAPTPGGVVLGGTF